MLKLDIHPLLALKGATKKLAYLYNRGLSEGRAKHLISKNIKTISIADIEKLCLIFNCTPNDLFIYEESVSNPLPQNSALKKIVRTPIPSMPELVKDLSIEQTTELMNRIIQFKKED
jgi:DNA-binding Xre family transcriptional regulator